MALSKLIRREMQVRESVWDGNWKCVMEKELMNKAQPDFTMTGVRGGAKG